MKPVDGLSSREKPRGHLQPWIGGADGGDDAERIACTQFANRQNRLRSW